MAPNKKKNKLDPIKSENPNERGILLDKKNLKFDGIPDSLELLDDF